jgi:hypothetical protein
MADSGLSYAEANVNEVLHHQQYDIIGYPYMPKVVRNADSLLFYNF